MANKYFLLILIPVLLFQCSYLPEEQSVPDELTVTEDRNYIFITPGWEGSTRTGLVFYPGALVDPHAYIEPLSQFAKLGKGHVIVIVKMPGNLPVFDPYEGAWMYDKYPSVVHWFIGGHSLGGVMASATVKKYPKFFRGLLLLASYPQESDNLSSWNRYVLSVWGEFDQVLEPNIVMTSAPLLPPAYSITRAGDIPLDQSPKTFYCEIRGGNHAQFGNYGPQKGDGTATITRQEQTSIWVYMLQRIFEYYVWD